MLRFAVPGFLLAGALAMLVPLALHLIRRRPPGRAPLPTTRFLSPDPRNAVRVSRPTDLLLLALRMLLLLLAGAAFARPAWLPAPRGTSTVVLLDRSAAMGDAWREAVGSARGALLGADGGVRGELVLFDTAAVRVPRARIRPALFDSLAAARPAGAADYAAALRAVPPAARELRGSNSVRVRMISALRQEGWSTGLAPLRRAAWPGSLELVPVAAARAGADTAPPARERSAVVAASGGGGRYVAAALAALGYAVRTASPAAVPGDADVYVVL
ncbi:MAG TPA: BatA domain-containing protein, partial [Longimicrobium sp.]|nr:BatA domain-containing protein [Longimicrobium sp.]